MAARVLHPAHRDVRAELRVRARQRVRARHLPH